MPASLEDSIVLNASLKPVAKNFPLSFAPGRITITNKLPYILIQLVIEGISSNKEVAEHAKNISQICVILHTRRASVYFKNALAHVATGGIWSPEVSSMEDFICRLVRVVVCIF